MPDSDESARMLVHVLAPVMALALSCKLPCTSYQASRQRL